jgi:hypothetical protein
LAKKHQNYIKVGRDIIIGRGFSAKHWSGPIVFGRDAIYICPNASEAAVLAGMDSGAAAGVLFGAIGGAIAAAMGKAGPAQPDWTDCVVDLLSLPSEALASSDWPVRKKKRPVIVLDCAAVQKIERKGGRLLVTFRDETFKLGVKFFGRGKVISAVRDLGWQI